MLWSILILTQPSRANFLTRLLKVLSPQIEKYSDVELTINYCNNEFDLGKNRAQMYENANGKYVNFIDDDDLVPDDYVASIYPLLDGVDYIGFEAYFFYDGDFQKPSYHSLRYNNWIDHDVALFRDLSHLNPIKKELAVLGKMQGITCEDRNWANVLRNLGVVKTEHYISKPMYFYYYRSIK